MDPLDLRIKNMIQPGDRWFGGGEVASNGLAECIEKARAAAGWQQGRALTARPGKRRALGVAACAHISGLLATGAIVRLLEDGSVVLNTGAVDIGQGSDTVLTQMCASALRVPADRVAIASPDTDGSPYNWGTTASRVTYTTGRSVVAAAGQVAEEIKRHAAEIFECAVGDLELRDGGRVGIVGVPDKELSYFEVSARAHWAAGGPIVGADTWVYNKPSVDPKRAIARGLPFPQIGVYSFGCMIVAVEIDETTGKADAVEVWSAMDVGKAINPGSVEGQIEGGFVQGMGFALTEEMVFERPAPREPLDDGLQGADLARRALRYPFDRRRGPPSPTGRSAPRGSGRSGWCPCRRRSPMRWRRRPARGLRRLPLTPERVLNGLLESDNED